MAWRKVCAAYWTCRPFSAGFIVFHLVLWIMITQMSMRGVEPQPTHSDPMPVWVGVLYCVIGVVALFELFGVIKREGKA